MRSHLLITRLGAALSQAAAGCAAAGGVTAMLTCSANNPHNEAAGATPFMLSRLTVWPWHSHHTAPRQSEAPLPPCNAGCAAPSSLTCKYSRSACWYRSKTNHEHSHGLHTHQTSPATQGQPSCHTVKTQQLASAHAQRLGECSALASRLAAGGCTHSHMKQRRRLPSCCCSSWLPPASPRCIVDDAGALNPSPVVMLRLLPSCCAGRLMMLRLLPSCCGGVP